MTTWYVDGGSDWTESIWIVVVRMGPALVWRDSCLAPACACASRGATSACPIITTLARAAVASARLSARMVFMSDPPTVFDGRAGARFYLGAGAPYAAP